MNDFEFVEKILEPLETRIYQDRQVIKMAKAAKKRSLDHGNADH